MIDKPLKCPVRVIGITGTIASGKSMVYEWVTARINANIWNADKHDTNLDKRLNDKGENQPVFDEIVKKWPNLAGKNEIDKPLLRQMVTENPDFLVVLEYIVHPYLKQSFNQIRTENIRANNRLVCDVPLLCEMGLYKLCDLIVIVQVSEQTTNVRLAKRPQMSPQLKNHLKRKQWKLDQKVKAIEKAHLAYEIVNNEHKADTKKQLFTLIEKYALLSPLNTQPDNANT